MGLRTRTGYSRSSRSGEDKSHRGGRRHRRRRVRLRCHRRRQPRLHLEGTRPPFRWPLARWMRRPWATSELVAGGKPLDRRRRPFTARSRETVRRRLDSALPRAQGPARQPLDRRRRRSSRPLRCHAGCRPEEIVAALGLELPDLFADTRTTPGDSRATLQHRRQTRIPPRIRVLRGRADEATVAPLQPDQEGLRVCTLEAYAEAKGLPVEFLRSLGLSDYKYVDTPAVRMPYVDRTATSRRSASASRSTATTSSGGRNARSCACTG